MSTSILYEGKLDARSISRMKIPVRCAIRAAIFDNFRSELTVGELLSLLPSDCSEESLISICRKLHFLSCKVYYKQGKYPGFNCRVYFVRYYNSITSVNI